MTFADKLAEYGEAREVRKDLGGVVDVGDNDQTKDEDVEVDETVVLQSRGKLRLIAPRRMASTQEQRQPKKKAETRMMRKRSRSKKDLLSASGRPLNASALLLLLTT